MFVLTRCVCPQRATIDSHPGNAASGVLIGLSGMLNFALGIWPSRDNVWTNNSIDQAFPIKRVYAWTENAAETQTLMAVLSGGLYGPSDGAYGGNRSLIMRSCRDDGLLLRPDKPMTMMDTALTALPFEGATGIDGQCVYGGWHGAMWGGDLTCSVVNVFATHSDIPVVDDAGETRVRFGYIFRADLGSSASRANFSVVPTDFAPFAKPSAAYRVWEYWHGLRADATHDSTILCDHDHPFAVPPTPRFPHGSLYHVLAPVLANGWCYLGEPQKIVTASARRVRSITATSIGVDIVLVGSVKEVITAVLRSPNASVHWVSCTAIGAVDAADAGVDTDSVVRIHCEANSCKCLHVGREQRVFLQLEDDGT